MVSIIKDQAEEMKILHSKIEDLEAMTKEACGKLQQSKSIKVPAVVQVYLLGGIFLVKL